MSQAVARELLQDWALVQTGTEYLYKNELQKKTRDVFVGQYLTEGNINKSPITANTLLKLMEK
jgi:hypothetical protein